jgi:hypothetical protein
MKFLRIFHFQVLGSYYRQDFLIAGVVDTAEKFIGGVVDTGEQFQHFWLCMTSPIKKNP